MDLASENGLCAVDFKRYRIVLKTDFFVIDLNRSMHFFSLLPLPPVNTFASRPSITCDISMFHIPEMDCVLPGILWKVLIFQRMPRCYSSSENYKTLEVCDDVYLCDVRIRFQPSLSLSSYPPMSSEEEFHWLYAADLSAMTRKQLEKECKKRGTESFCVPFL